LRRAAQRTRRYTQETHKRTDRWAAHFVVRGDARGGVVWRGRGGGVRRGARSGRGSAVGGPAIRAKLVGGRLLRAALRAEAWHGSGRLLVACAKAAQTFCHENQSDSSTWVD
jgi:hypothetical protein